jgi:hypothetical protein
MSRGKLPRIGKLEAARRQIGFAISAHFSNGDPFAIHTVISAAFGILHALAEKHGSVRAHQAISDHIRPGKEREYWSYMNRASNFLKHADRDSDAMLEDVSDEVNDSAILFAILYYADLSGSPLPPTMAMFSAWYVCLHPSVMTDEFRSKVLSQIPQAELDRVRNSTRDVQLEAGLGLLKQIRGER